MTAKEAKLIHLIDQIVAGDMARWGEFQKELHGLSHDARERLVALCETSASELPRRSREETRAIILDRGTWAHRTHLCLRRGSLPIPDAKDLGVMLRGTDLREPFVLICNSTDLLLGKVLVDAPAERFKSLDELLDAGWEVGA